MKKCRKCHEIKPLTDFYRAAGMRDGYRNDCKSCNLASQHQRYLADPDTAIARVKKWQQENATRLNAYRRARRADPAVKLAERAGHLRRKYGMTVAEYDTMLAKQDGLCALCRRPPGLGVSFHVDHDHNTGTIRGLLCFKCNNALGDFDDDPDRLRAAAAYLDPFSRDPEVEAAWQERLAGLKRLAAAG